MTRTNTQTKTTTTPVSDCACAPKASPTHLAWTVAPAFKPLDPALQEIRFTGGDIIDFMARWLKDNAPADVCALFEQYQALWLAETSYHDNGGQISPRDIGPREVMAAIYAAKAGLFRLDPDFEVSND